MLHEFGGYEGYTLYAKDTFNAIIAEAQKVEDLSRALVLKTDSC